VPVVRPEIVKEDPDPLKLEPSGVLVIVHDPDGSPLRTTLPVAVEQVG
jgi:hypothetical protein